MRNSHSCMLGIVGVVLLLSGGQSWAGTNTAYGTWALQFDTSGSYNSAFGYAVLWINITGSNNTGVGLGVLQGVVTASNNTAIGSQALYTSGSATAVTTGSWNTAVGYNALYTDTTGGSNTAIGYNALFANNSGDYNTASGNNSLSANTTGFYNTAFGYKAGEANKTGSSNIFIGNLATANAANYTNGTALGNEATVTASNSIVLGNDKITKIYAKVTTITAISDLRHKKDIAALPSDLGLDFIAKLKPVSYRFNDGDETERFGFIAQDIEQALPASLRDTIERSEPEHGLALIERQNDTDRTYRVSYGELFAPMVKAIQEQQQEITAAHQESADLRHAIEAQATAFNAEIDALRHSVEALRQRVAAAR